MYFCMQQVGHMFNMYILHIMQFVYMQHVVEFFREMGLQHQACYKEAPLTHPVCTSQLEEHAKLLHIYASLNGQKWMSPLDMTWLHAWREERGIPFNVYDRGHPHNLHESVDILTEMTKNAYRERRALVIATGSHFYALMLTKTDVG